MHDDGEEDGAGGPAVQPVEALVGDAGEQADGVELAAQEVDEGDLGDGDPGGAEADNLPLVGIQGIARGEDDVAPEDDEQGGPVDGQGDPLTEGHRGEISAEASGEDERLGVGHLAQHGGGGGDELRDGTGGLGHDAAGVLSLQTSSAHALGQLGQADTCEQGDDKGDGIPVGAGDAHKDRMASIGTTSSDDGGLGCGRQVRSEQESGNV
nr:hypothetical protein CFP56_16798 [Quercus suber]